MITGAFLRRYVRGPYLSWVQTAHVVSSDDRGLLLAVPDGTGFACRIDARGAPQREAPLSEVGAAPLQVRRWVGNSVLILVRPGHAHSVWWFFRDGVFTDWYVNLESPSQFWSQDGLDGLDTTDHGLDVVVGTDHAWRWKDEDDFEEFTGEPGYWTAAQAVGIRQEGLDVIAEVEAGRFPFDGTWCDAFPDLPPLELPPGWDTPPVRRPSKPSAVPPTRTHDAR